MSVIKFYTSDLHVGHENVIGYDQRPFKNAKEMEEELITRWNTKVRMKDSVYIIGDIGLCSRQRVLDFLENLNGMFHLVIGNHDEYFVKNDRFRWMFESMDRLKYIKDGQVKIMLCHYPMRSWRGSSRGSYHLYGHIHNSKGPNPFIYENSANVGTMLWNFEPVTFDEIMEKKKFYDSILRNQQAYAKIMTEDLPSCSHDVGDIDDIDVQSIH